MTTHDTVHVLYENEAWLPPLVAGLEAEGLPCRLVPVVDGAIDIAEAPPPGIWLNRMSPSSHTRGHGTSVALMGEVLAWLESWGSRVVNGTRAYLLEMSKLRQHLALARHGIRTPRTVLCVGREALLAAAEGFEGAFITKHNRGGKGLGIALYRSAGELARATLEPGWDPGSESQVFV
jgi:hypothetical protein